jgi:DNA-binding NarL/FixJ family response regulator
LGAAEAPYQLTTCSSAQPEKIRLTKQLQTLGSLADSERMFHSRFLATDWLMEETLQR